MLYIVQKKSRRDKTIKRCYNGFMKSMVHVRKCSTYDPNDVFQAVESAVHSAEERNCFPDVKGKTVLLKPNMLIAADPRRAVSTHPEVLRSAIRVFTQRGGRILVGESPAVQGSLFAARKCGLLRVTEEEGARWVDFSTTVNLENPQGKLVKRFEVASEAVEADFVVSLPKLKTHQLMYYTGAIKNLFGTISGLQKARFHLRFPERRDFGAMLVDLAVALKPSFAIMDGIIAMEGHGPADGTPRSVGLILASADIAALDWIAASVIGYDPATLVYLVDARSRGLWMTEEPVIDGPPLEDLIVRDFKRLRVSKEGAVPRTMVPGSLLKGALYNVARNIIVPRPFFRHDQCIRCGQCVAICPAQALRFIPNPSKIAKAGLPTDLAEKRIEVDYKTCLRCYCCHEVCPESAIVIKRF